MLKAALYARVSSEEQAKRENSIPAQLRALREYCQKNNIEIFKEYKDEGITGQISKRPAFQQMLSAAFSAFLHRRLSNATPSSYAGSGPERCSLSSLS